VYTSIFNWKTSFKDIYKRIQKVGFELLTAVSTKMAVFWVVAPCSLVEVYQRFGGPCCLHHQGETLVNFYQTTRQTSIFIQKRVKLVVGIVVFINRFPSFIFLIEAEFAWLFNSSGSLVQRFYMVIKNHATHSWHMFYLSKNRLHWNQKTKSNVILSVGNVHCIQWCMHSVSSSCLMKPGEEFLCHRSGSPGEVLSVCLAQENWEMYP
jgi:hypothetical protein